MKSENDPKIREIGPKRWAGTWTTVNNSRWSSQTAVLVRVKQSLHQGWPSIKDITAESNNW